MPPWISYLVVACFALSVLLALLDYFHQHFWPRLLTCIVLLGIAFALAITIGFPFATSRRAFGGASPVLAVALMFLGVVIGIAATYVFNLTGAFSWRDLARPLVVSPLVLLPLIGSLQGAALEPVQLVCFIVLAFQNGFFWQQVLRDAKPSTYSASSHHLGRHVADRGGEGGSLSAVQNVF
jgi:hypothetical protein